MRRITLRALGLALIALTALARSAAAAEIGAVVLHGKWGNPASMTPLVSALQDAGIDVAAPEMPWSGRRLYDAPVEKADEQVDAEIAGLRARGAKKVFVIGQSLGAAYVVHFATRATPTGIVAIAPAHRTEIGAMRQTAADALREAHALIAAGKPDEIIGFTDLNQGKRSYLRVRPGPFVSYFDPDGAFNMKRNVESLKPDVPVLWLVPTGEPQPGRNGVVALYQLLPKNAGTRFGEPDAGHFEAPAAAARTVVEW